MPNETAPVTTAAPAATTPNTASTGQNVQSQTANTSKTTQTDAKTAQNDKSAKPDTEYFDVPSNGKIRRMTRAEIIAAASHGDAAQEKFREAAQMRKDAEGFMSKIRNPKEMMKLLQDPKLGLNQQEVRAEFENWYAETYIKREQMTPEQRELADAKTRLKDYEDRELSAKEQKQKEEDDALDNQTREQLQKEIIELLDSSGLPRTKFTARRIAYWMRVNSSQKINAPKELIISQVKHEIRENVSSMVESSDGDVLVNLLGEGTVKKLRKYDLDRLRAKRNLPNPEGTPSREQAEPRKKITYAEVNRRMSRLRMGGKLR